MCIKSLVVAVLVCLPTGAAIAQDASPEGRWRDEYGTIFEISRCGHGGDLCAILIDVQGKSRTERNLAYVNQQVLRASQTAETEWKGTVLYNGNQANATVTQHGPETLSITGCQAIFCNTLVFTKANR